MVPDELLFITVHQVFELWLKLLLFELAHGRDEMLEGHSHAARVRLERCHTIERILLEQFDVLDSMEPSEFHRFRGVLGTASGAQSVQFLEVEFLSGLKEQDYGKNRDWITAAEHEVLRGRLSEPDLWEGFLAILRRAGFDTSTRQHRSAAFLAIARDREKNSTLWDLLKAMIGHDRFWWMWRARHSLVVDRQIGAKCGTHGSTGVSHLQSRLTQRFYPELWELGSML